MSDREYVAGDVFLNSGMLWMLVENTSDEEPSWTTLWLDNDAGKILDISTTDDPSGQITAKDRYVMSLDKEFWVEITNRIEEYRT